MKLVPNNNIFEIICDEDWENKNKNIDPKFPMIPIVRNIIENENKLNKQMCVKNDSHIYYVYDNWHLVIKNNKFIKNNEIIPIERQLECIIIEEYNKNMEPIVHKFYRHQDTIYYNDKKLIMPNCKWNLKLILP